MARYPGALLACIAFSAAANATPIRFATMYGSNMVLQRAPQRAVVWGYFAGPASYTVSVAAAASTGSGAPPVVVAGTVSVFPTPPGEGPAGTSTWRALLDPVRGGADPYRVTATVHPDDGGTPASATLDNVLFGDVWVCSGQSNMAFLLANAFNGSALVQDANHWPLIRLFTSTKLRSSAPLAEQPRVEEPWAVASNVSVDQNNRAGGYPGGWGDDSWLYMSAVCWLYAREVHKATGAPVGVYNTNWGGSAIEVWSSPAALARCPGSAAPSHKCRGTAAGGAASCMYNGMIHPLLNTTIKGAIWYQGEQNVGHADLYACQEPAMIADWRARWHDANPEVDALFPFGLVQLAPWVTAGDVAALRWAQTARVGRVPNAALPNVFMAVAHDLGDRASPYGSVHTRHKQEVGYRLGLAGRAVAYGEKGLYWTGPLVSGAAHATDGSGAVVVSFDGVGAGGLTVKNASAGWLLCPNASEAALDGCVAGGVTATGAASVTVAPQADCANGTTAAGPFAAVRYGWESFPFEYLEASLYSSDGKTTGPLALLPAPPFVVDVVDDVSWTPPTYNSTVINAFRNKTCTNAIPMGANPYWNGSLPTPNASTYAHVCGVKYADEALRHGYALRTYASAGAAVADGAHVSHLHACGACSTLYDLATYMAVFDLTKPVRACGVKGFIGGESVVVKCLEAIGLTPACAVMWYYNANNTRHVCLGKCLADWSKPYNDPPNSTTLNACLECDETKSGPLFKRFAARTRRDSGLLSAIRRPPASIYHVVHDYW